MNAPWHYESYTHFTTDTLPALLEQHMGIERAARTLAASTLPPITDEGVLPGDQVVLPRASSENLAEARIACVGEQLAEWIGVRLSGWQEGGLPPLAAWLDTFLTERGQPLDTTNTLARLTHLRRIVVDAEVVGWHPSHVNRVCAIETPEGPRVGRILTIARGASIVQGALIPGTEPLGLVAGCLPFLAHTSDARGLMGANMYRQWQPLPAAEPALVQTGNEPATPAVWCGLNLRTAFLPWGHQGHEDAFVVSESAAARFVGPTGRPLAIGDKIANRHGAKGIVGAILPDREMPWDENGQAIELIYTFFGVPSRMNAGQLLEAALGAVAARQGTPALAPPFASPTRGEVQSRRRAVGLSADGLEQLQEGATGTRLERRSATGIAYWGRLAPDAADKLKVGDQTVGPVEYQLLRAAGATALLDEFFGGWAATRLTERLGALGLAPVRVSEGLTITVADNDGPDAVALGEELPHPWLPERTLTAVGTVALPELTALRDAVERLQRMKAHQAPSRLREDARRALETRLWDYADALLSPDQLVPEATVPRSGRSVCAPAPWLEPDQIGLPEPLFARCAEAAWVLVLACPMPGPVPGPTTLVALRPVPVPGDAIRFPVLLCQVMDTDFDGDPITVFAPRTPAATEELVRLFSPAGRLTREPALLREPYGGLLLGHGAFYGLAERARTPAGRAEVERLLGRSLASTSGPCLTRAALEPGLQSLLREEGADAALDACVRLAEAGFAAAKRSGASLSPFATVDFPPPPTATDPRAWSAWGTALIDTATRLPVTVGFDDDRLGAVLLSAASGARGRLLHLVNWHASNAHGGQIGPEGQWVPVAHGLLEGLTLTEWLAAARHYRLALRRLFQEDLLQERFLALGSGFLARALRAERPGVVLARAALTGECDPLTDPDSGRALEVA